MICHLSKEKILSAKLFSKNLLNPRHPLTDEMQKAQKEGMGNLTHFQIPHPITQRYFQSCRYSTGGPKRLGLGSPLIIMK